MVGRLSGHGLRQKPARNLDLPVVELHRGIRPPGNRAGIQVYGPRLQGCTWSNGRDSRLAVLLSQPVEQLRLIRWAFERTPIWISRKMLAKRTMPAILVTTSWVWVQIKAQKRWRRLRHTGGNSPEINSSRNKGQPITTLRSMA